MSDLRRRLRNALRKKKAEKEDTVKNDYTGLAGNDARKFVQLTEKSVRGESFTNRPRGTLDLLWGTAEDTRGKYTKVFLGEECYHLFTDSRYPKKGEGILQGTCLKECHDGKPCGATIAIEKKCDTILLLEEAPKGNHHRHAPAEKRPPAAEESSPNDSRPFFQINNNVPTFLDKLFFYIQIMLLSTISSAKL